MRDLGGEGNALFYFDGVDASSDTERKKQIRAQLPNLKFTAPAESWPAFEQKYKEMGGVVEEFVEESTRYHRPRSAESMQSDRLNPSPPTIKCWVEPRDKSLKDARSPHIRITEKKFRTQVCESHRFWQTGVQWDGLPPTL